ncbi:hypothetical protein Tco_0025298 [Tanacetum coccineum]
MQQFWYTIKKVKDSESYEFLLANKKCMVDAEVFRKILDICPRVKGEEFTEVQGEEEVEWIDSNEDEEKKDDDDDDKSINLEKTDDEETNDEFVHSGEYVQTDDKETDDEFVQGDEQVNGDKDEEMTNAEVEDSGKGDAEMFDVAKADAEKIEELKDYAKKAELPPISSSLSISLGFGDQFLKLSSDTSLISTVKENTDAEINSLLDIKIQFEVLNIQSPSVLTVPVSVISEPSVLTPLQETPSVATPAPESSKIQTPTINLEQESKKSASEIRKIKRQQAEKQKMPKIPANHALYHALMEALIEDENDMDKEGKNTKRRRTKESESSKKPSTTKETSKGKAPSKGSKTGKSASAKEPIKEPIAEVVMDDELNTVSEDVVHDDDQPQDTSEPKTDKTPNPEWFKQPPRPPTPDPKWNKRQVVLGQHKHPWFNQMVSAINDPLTFNDLMATPIEFSKYVLNRLKIDNLTQDLLLGAAYNMLKGTCTSSIKLEYNFQECFNALTDKLDWNNPKGDRYPFDLSKPLPLQGHPGHLTVVADYFFNNDLEYLKTFDLEKTYTTSITKTKVARYEIVGIEDMVPMLWSTIKHAYDKDDAKGIKHWGERRKLWYGSQMNKFFKQNVYSTQKILGVKSVSIKKLHEYGHLEEVVVKRADRHLYKFKKGDFVDLHMNDIEDMLILVVQQKIFHLNDSDIVDFIVALCMFTRSLVIKGRVEDLQLGVESYQKKLNITAPQQTFPQIEFKELYTPSCKPPRVIYEDLTKQKRVMRADELYKFSDGTLKKV